MSTNAKPTFRGSIRLGRLLGIDVYLHVTFLLLLAFVSVSSGLAGGSVQAALGGGLFFAGLFLCVLLHEFGHALAARHYGIGTREITLLPIGGLARLERLPERPSQELVVALAGPAVNLVIALGLGVGLWLGGHGLGLHAFTPTEGGVWTRLLAANLFLVGFNLLPAFPMDGGRVLRSLLAMRWDHVRATRIAARTGQGMAVLFGFAGLFGNPMLLLIAVFVWFGAAQELGASEMKAGFGDAEVGAAMLTEFKVLTPGQTVRDAVTLLLAGSQTDFPVVERGAVVGILTRDDLARALRERGEDSAVATVMRREFPVLSVGSRLEAALVSENVEKCLTMPVVDSGRLVGLLTAENVGEYLMIRAALGGRARPPGDASGTPQPPVLTSLPGPGRGVVWRPA